MPRLLRVTSSAQQQTPVQVQLSAIGMKISKFQTSGGRWPRSAQIYQKRNFALIRQSESFKWYPNGMAAVNAL